MTYLVADEVTTYRARCVLTSDRKPLHGGFVAIRNGRIESVSALADGPFVDLGDVIVFPAPINCHTHLEFSDLSKPLGHVGIDFPQWVRMVIDNRAASSEAEKADRIQLGLDECRRSATVAIGEIATYPWSFRIREDDPLIVSFFECIGLSGDLSLDWTKRWGSLCERSVGATNFVPGISPHAPYSVHTDLLNAVCQLARTKGQPIAMHLAETREELELLATGKGPMRDMLDRLGVWNPSAFSQPRDAQYYLDELGKVPRALVVHGNYLTQAQLTWLGQHVDRVSLVYCPRTHEFFAHEVYPLDGALRSGVRVVLGTDSRASNPDLSVWNDGRHVVAQYAHVPPDRIFRMLLCGAAEALGIGHAVGRIETGMNACIASVDWTDSLADPWLAVWESDPATLRIVSNARFG